MARRDSQTLDMFDVPVERQPLPGALNVALPLRSLLASMMKASALSRLQLAARMSELTGLEITEDQLNSWTAPSREGWRFPLEYLPAFEVALETHELTAWLADLRGARLSVGCRLTIGPKSTQPRKKSRGLRQRAWDAMRSECKFTIPSLMGIVCNGSEKDAEGNLGHYLHVLYLTGFINKLPRGVRGESPKGKKLTRYVVVRNSGRSAPVWRLKSGTVSKAEREHTPLDLAKWLVELAAKCGSNREYRCRVM